jgi:hypothetical protein
MSFEDLDIAKRVLIARADREAAIRRLRTLDTTDAAKIAMLDHKYRVARDAVAGDAAALAMLEGEATARGMTAADLAALIVQRGGEWRAIGMTLEAAAGAHKTAISALTSLDDANAYDVTTGWPE